MHRELFKQFEPGNRSHLIGLLQDVQDIYGYVPEIAMMDIAEFLELPTSSVYGVATFYNQFRFQPKGKYHIQVCRGTACHVLGSSNVMQELEKTLKIKNDETSRDGKFSLEVVACIGACGLAPVISINGEFHAKVTPESIKEIIGNLE